jgi:hypothetical protein
MTSCLADMWLVRDLRAVRALTRVKHSISSPLWEAEMSHVHFKVC